MHSIGKACNYQLGSRGARVTGRASPQTHLPHMPVKTAS